MSSYLLTHLKQLEAESIHIIREVAAEFEKPVMLYSIGKDSSVMVRLAQKAFHPGRLPFPLLHVDTTWKFREMIAFRDTFCREHGLDLIVHTNAEGEAQGHQPVRPRQQEVHRRHEDGGAEAGARPLAVRRGVRRRPPRRGEVAGQGARLLLPRPPPPVGPEEPAAGAVEPVQRQGQQGREHPRLPAVQLDRARRLAIHPPREHPDRAALLRRAAAGRRARRHADHGRRRAAAAAARREAGDEACPLPHARLLPAHRRDRIAPRRRCRRSSRRCCWRRTPSGRAG